MVHRTKFSVVILALCAAVITPAGVSSAASVASDVEVNDDDSDYFSYPTGKWEYIQDEPAKFHGDDHYTHEAGAKAQFRFTGTKVVLKGARASHHGTATVSVDGGAPTTVSQKAAVREENVPFYTSPVLPEGSHTITITVVSGTFALDSAVVGAGGSTPPGAMPRITVNGNKIYRDGQEWWLTGYNSFVWTGDCGDPHEVMTPAEVDAWFASMRHDGHGGVRLFFFEEWDTADLDAAVASAKRHNIYLTITLDDALDNCGETEKTPEWFADDEEREAYQRHMVKLLTRYKGETAIAWFEYFNEPGDHDTWRLLKDFYDEMGDIAQGVDPDRLFSSGTVAPYWLGDDESRFRTVSGSRGVDIVSVHEYDQDQVISYHYGRAKANSAGKPIIVGEFGLYANNTGGDCDDSFATRAKKVLNKLNAYIRDSANAGAFGWAWQPGSSPAECVYGNFDIDRAAQAHFRQVTK
jgi:hypothetical protein